MAATIKIKNSSTAGAAPTSSDLVQGELAVNVTDKRLYTENASGTIVELGTNPSVPVTFPDGSASAPSLTNDGDTNTGLFFPAADTIALTTGGTERARVDSSGNLGLGVTPSAWGSGFKAIDVNTYGAVASSTSALRLFANSYNDGTNWTYKTTAAASRYDLSGGAHAWLIAGSGTAGNAITWTQAMTLDASGNLGTNGQTSPGTFQNAGITIGTGNTNYGVNIYSSSSAFGDICFAKASSGVGLYNGMVRYSHSSDYMSFWTASTERARIDSSGNLLVGTTSVVNSGFVNIVCDATSKTPISIKSSASAAAAYLIRFVNNSGTDVGAVQMNASNNGLNYLTSSDYRLKENIQPMTGALAKVAALKPCTYTWKDCGASGQGFIAHELQEVVPECVSGEKDAVETYIDDEGNEQTKPKYQGIDTSHLVATLTAAIQELKAEFDAYKAAHP